MSRVKSSTPFAMHHMNTPFSLQNSGHALHGVKIAQPATYSLQPRPYRLHGIALSPALVPDWAPDWVYNAATSELRPSQVGGKVSDCAASNYRAGGGRITMDEARAACEKDINAVIGINNREADSANLKTAALVCGVLLTGLYLVTRR